MRKTNVVIVLAYKIAGYRMTKIEHIDLKPEEDLEGGVRGVRPANIRKAYVIQR
jgi:hypothetical protein